MLCCCFSATAQIKNPQYDNPKYGPDEATRKECLKHTSFYQSYYKQGSYDDAASSWGIVYNICPLSSKNIYIRGVRMLKRAIDEAVDPAVKKKLIDSLMHVYDKRIQYFREEAFVQGEKGRDLLQLAPQRFEEAYHYLHRAFELDKEKTDPIVLLALMQTARERLTNGQITADTILTLYPQLSDAINSQMKANPGDEKLAQISESLDALFTGAGVADCNSLVSIYGPKFEEDPTNVELAQTIHQQLSSMRCTDQDLYLKTSIVLFNNDPTANLGNEIARLYKAKREYQEADEYYKRAIVAETDSVRKSAMLVEYADFVGNTLGEKARARKLAYDALQYNPKQGYSYYLIGTLYAGTKNCGTSKMDNWSVYWAAVDKFEQAMRVDPQLAADCRKQIEYLSQFFPTNEEIFFQDFKVGDPYKVPCWIGETTSIRAKSE